MKTTSNNELEKQLLPRLRKVGFLIVFFGLLSLAYSLIFSPDLSLAQNPEIATAGLSSAPVSFNLHLVSSVFFIIGSTCLLSTWKRKFG